MIRCKYCKQRAVKNGFQNSIQRYKCISCKKVFKLEYNYKAYNEGTNQNIIDLLKEGVGIRGISRLLKISPTTVISRIKTIANQLKPPMLFQGKSYEVDEMHTYVNDKNFRQYVCLGVRTDTKEVVRIGVGKRSGKYLKTVTDPIVLSSPKVIYTDRWKAYKSILPRKIHKIKKGRTNKIERINLNVRTHLKRLNRRTIAFSKSSEMLLACVKIYFWT